MTQPSGPIGLADIDRIVEISKRLPVFPAAQNKRPLVQSGFHAATQDERQIRAWWREWPDALVAVPTGQTTGLVIIDFDPDKATQATRTWMAEHSELLLATRSHKTPRGGLHYVYRSTDRYQTGTDLVLGGSPRRGIDLRANGGYVIWWPAHLAQVNDSPVAPLPAGLIDERRFDAKRDMAPLPAATPQQWKAERQKVAQALEFLTPDGYEFWIRIGMALHSASGGSDDGFSLWHDWSATGDSYDGVEDCRYHWASFGGYQGRPIGLGTLFAAAKQEGYCATPMRQELPPVEIYEDDPPSEDEGMPEDAAETAQEAQGDAPARHPLSWATLATEDPPERKWAIPGWLGIGYMTLLAGSGGVGKTLLAQQLASSLATGDPFLHQPTKPLKILMWAGEDDTEELWRRQWQIARGNARMLAEYAPNLIVESFAGRDCTLVETIYGKLIATEMLKELEEQVADYQADVVILDNVARLYGGDENNRHQVTTFVNLASGACNKRHPTAQLLLSHPAKAAGSEYAGSTAWEAAVRSRWYFGRTLPDDDTPPTDDNIRFLSRRKSNYSGLDTVKMDFDPALHILRIDSGEPVDNRRTLHPARARNMVVDAVNRLAAQNDHASERKRASNFLIRTMVDRGWASASHERALEQALWGLLDDGTVAKVTVGKYANRTSKEGLICTTVPHNG